MSALRTQHRCSKTLGYTPIVLVALRRFFPDFDAEATGAGLAIGGTDFAINVDGRRFLRPAGRVPETILSSRMGYALSPLGPFYAV
jgi:hypothetical protein